MRILLILFFLALSSSAYAVWPGDCQFVIEDSYYGLHICGDQVYNYPSSGVSGREYIWDGSGWSWQAVTYPPGTDLYKTISFTARLYYYENGEWHLQDIFSNSGGTYTVVCDLDTGGTPSGLDLPPGCCEDKRQELIGECGPDNYEIDLMTCTGNCLGACPDADQDGVADTCDPCDQNPDITEKILFDYYVTDADCTNLYEMGQYCGYSFFNCEGEEEIHPAPGFFETQTGGIACCDYCGAIKVDCVWDTETCEAHTGDPGICICPDTDGDGDPNAPCSECKKCGCECPDSDGDGSPDDVCEECQKPDDCECPDNNGDGNPDNACDQCQCFCPDGGTLCAECQKPGCECPDSDGDGSPDAGPCAECEAPHDCVCPDGTTSCAQCDEGGDGGDGGDDGGGDDGFDDPGDELPDEIQVGDCTVDITAFKQWLVTGDAFPFNFLYRLMEVLDPILSFDGQLTNQTIEIDNISGWGYSFTIPFEDYNSIASLIRWCFRVTIVITVISYGISRYNSISGIKY